MGITFSLTVFAWIFFRAQDMTHALSYISTIFSRSIFSNPYFPGIGLAVSTMYMVIIFMIIEWKGRENQFAIQIFMNKWPRLLKWSVYMIIIFSILLFNGEEQQFIYFQF